MKQGRCGTIHVKYVQKNTPSFMTSNYVSIPIMITYKSHQMNNIEGVVRKNYIYIEHSYVS